MSDGLAFAGGALTAFVILALAWFLANERGRRISAEQRLAALEQAMANLKRADNGLYRESIEDLRARELRAADSVAVGVEHMLNAIRVLAPEMLKKSKR